MALFTDGPAMSHKEKMGEILGRVLPYLTFHAFPWYRDRHYHKTHRELKTCACCRTNNRQVNNTCGLCAAAWSLSAVNVIFKKEVYENGVTFKPWFRLWTAEERALKAVQRKSKGKGKGKGNGWHRGYEPHAYHQAQAPQLSITNTDSWASWDTPVQEWAPRPPLEPQLPPRVVEFIAELDLIAQLDRPPSPPSMWTLPPLEHQDQPEKKDEDSSSCRKDEKFDQLTSRLAALAVAFDGRKHVPEEEENSCHNDEDYEQTTSRQAAFAAAFIEEFGPEEEQEFEPVD